MLDANQPLHDATYVAMGTATIDRTSHAPSASAPRPKRRNPAARRAPMSHATASPTNAATYQIPSHLEAHAKPRQTPARTRHQRTPRPGPGPSEGSPALTASL